MRRVELVRSKRTLVVVVGAGALALTACAPVKKAPPPTGSDTFACVAGPTQKSQTFTVPAG